MLTILDIHFVKQACSLAAKSENLTSGKFLLLKAVSDLGGKEVMQRDLLRYFNDDAMTLSQLIRQMLQAKLITQSTHKTDRRVKLLTLTNEGAQVLKKIEQKIDQRLEPAVKSLGASKSKTLHSLLSQASTSYFSHSGKAPKENQDQRKRKATQKAKKK